MFGASGLVVPTWPVPYGGLDLPAASRAGRRRRAAPVQPRPAQPARPQPLRARAVRVRDRGAAAAVPPAHRAQRRGVVPAVQRARRGIGSRVARDARAERDGDEWVVTGQKVWTTWAHLADYGVLLARTDADVPKRNGLTYFLVDLHQPGVDVRPLQHIGGEVDFNEVFLEGARVPDAQRVGEIGDGWKVAGATLSGERQMVSGEGSGGVDRIGGSGTRRLLDLARRTGRADDATMRQELMKVVSEERIRDWTNQRVRAGLKAGRSPGPRELDRQGAPGRVEPAHPAAGVLLAGPGGDRVRERRAGLRRRRCRTRYAGCCAAAPTRSRAAPPR